MKKNLYLVVVSLFLLSGISYAQDQSSSEMPVKKPTFWWGPKVGADFLTPTIDQGAIQAQIKSNYQIGFFLQFGRKFYIQPEFYYATQKEPGITTDEVTINTLKVPLMLGMRLINLKVISAHIMAGPSASFLLKESVTDPTNPRPKSNFSLQAGGGIDLIGLFTLDVRYSFDMSNSMSNQIKQFSWDNGVNVTFGIKLR